MEADEIFGQWLLDLFDSPEFIQKAADEIARYNAGVKNKVISDFRCKYIMSQLEAGKELSPKDIDMLNELAGDEANMTPDLLGKYADNIRNYLYTYKPEAQRVDPRIDPSEEHVGPMAQDIEKVAPDCVNYTPEGVKTVDGARLALVNAGAIADLARKVQELEGKLNGRL